MKTTPAELELFRTLQPRLKQVSALLAQGLCYAEIGQRLNLARSTAHAYTDHAMGHTGIRPSLRYALFIVRHPEIETMMREALSEEQA